MTYTPSEEPPPFPLTAVDLATLAQTDEEFIPHTWEELKDILAANDLAAFRRKPSQLARYIKWTVAIKAEYGSTLEYLRQKRLRWAPPTDSKVTPSASSLSMATFRNPVPFADPSDYKILVNDWPYGTTPDITHLVVWLKTPFRVYPTDGSLTPESRCEIESFVRKTFVRRLEHLGEADDRVLWFKNTTDLQSVRALEHFHLFVRGVDPGILMEWTGEA
ncbi:MAG: hypothetical protein M1816_004686 [Peltula sp. TS41687]|nr:MAG: hypothetical protein M1816_004686 [Peltula sp. TS41687]